MQVAAMCMKAQFQSTLPARGATGYRCVVAKGCQISIHAPRTGSDVQPPLRRFCHPRYFNPRSPHGERRTPLLLAFTSSFNFNPRSPHGERREPKRLCARKGHISIHAPRTGSDHTSLSALATSSVFQSTLPARGATLIDSVFPTIASISIHAPRTGSDIVTLDLCFRHFISIHAPRTGSDKKQRGKRFLQLFQSTLPARGATFIWAYIATKRHHFNPRSPHGERPSCGSSGSCRMNFNPRSPHGERPRKVTILSIRIIGFAQKVYHKTVLLRISLAENAVILPEKPRNPVRTSLQKAGGLRFARAIRAARPYSISSPSGA